MNSWLGKYLEHRKRVENATNVVNSYAPKRKRIEIVRELTVIDMISALYNRGSMRTFTRSPSSLASIQNAAFKKREAVFCKRCRLQRNHSTAVISSTNDAQLQRCTVIRETHSQNVFKDKQRASNSIPPYVINRYNFLEVLDRATLRKVLRPRLYLDICIGDVRPLGRIIIQLYTEACPEIVLQFVKVFSNCNRSNVKFTRLYSPLWIEGELQLENSSLLGCNIDHDTLAVNHASGAGILSCPSRYLRGSKFRFLSFTISFKPSEVLNGKRLAIGRVQRGFFVLNILQNVAVARNGRPIKDIKITSCGLL